MPDAVELVKVIKKASVEAVNAAKPAEVLFGKVISVSPIQISVEQKILLGEKQLVFSRNVTDFEIEMTTSHETEYALGSHTHNLNGCGGNVDTANLSHCHSYSGKKSFTVHNGLVVGDEVILIRQQGGQKYFVADRIG